MKKMMTMRCPQCKKSLRADALNFTPRRDRIYVFECDDAGSRNLAGEATTLGDALFMVLATGEGDYALVKGKEEFEVANMHEGLQFGRKGFVSSRALSGLLGSRSVDKTAKIIAESP